MTKYWKGKENSCKEENMNNELLKKLFQTSNEIFWYLGGASEKDHRLNPSFTNRFFYTCLSHLKESGYFVLITRWRKLTSTCFDVIERCWHCISCYFLTITSLYIKFTKSKINKIFLNFGMVKYFTLRSNI